jgi:hypothetical protein
MPEREDNSTQAYRPIDARTHGQGEMADYYYSICQGFLAEKADRGGMGWEAFVYAPEGTNVRKPSVVLYNLAKPGEKAPEGWMTEIKKRIQGWFDGYSIPEKATSSAIYSSARSLPRKNVRDLTNATDTELDTFVGETIERSSSKMESQPESS